MVEIFKLKYSDIRIDHICVEKVGIDPIYKVVAADVSLCYIKNGIPMRVSYIYYDPSQKEGLDYAVWREEIPGACKTTLACSGSVMLRGKDFELYMEYAKECSPVIAVLKVLREREVIKDFDVGR
jgi:hypothetical protein